MVSKLPWEELDKRYGLSCLSVEPRWEPSSLGNGHESVLADVCRGLNDEGGRDPYCSESVRAGNRASGPSWCEERFSPDMLASRGDDARESDCCSSIVALELRFSTFVGDID